ncbi:MAG: copper amine oxidase N-terminal domain-containing protein [Defluviitaleaceae bacterium]|nr:copper amine oxidase N-terminal domain-containing protein [Defluviitaleaceae bacterium]
MKLKTSVKQFISLALVFVLCMGPVIPVRASQSNIISSITVTLPDTGGLTVTMTNVFDHYGALPDNDSDHFDGNFFFQTSGSISFNQDVTLAIPASFEHVNLRAGEVFRFEGHIPEWGTTGFTIDQVNLHLINQENFWGSVIFFTDYHYGSVAEIIRDVSFVGARPMVPLSQLVPGAAPAPPQMAPPVPPPAAPPNNAVLAPDNDAMLEMIRRTNGRRPFSNYDHPMSIREIREAQGRGTGAHVFSPRVVPGTTDRDFIISTANALHAMLNGQSDITHYSDSTLAEISSALNAFGGMLPEIGGFYTAASLIVDSLVLGLSTTNVSINEVRDVELLLLLHINAEEQPDHLRMGIEELLARDYLRAVEALLDSIESRLRSDTAHLNLAALGGPIGKGLSVMIKIAEMGNSLDARRNMPIVRIRVLQDIRETIWTAYDEIAARVLAGDFTEDDLITARNLFMMSSYLAEEQLVWMGPFLDGSNWVARNSGRRQGAWRSSTIIQGHLYQIQAVGQNPALYPYELTERGVLREWTAIAGGTASQAALRLSIGSTTYTQNGTPLQMDAAPFIADGRTMVPLALIASALGATTSWDGSTRTVTIVKADTTLRLTVDVPLPNNMGTPTIVTGRTFVPVAYISQMLGANVRWDGDARAVYIQQ